MPPDLLALYSSMDGGEFVGGVVLFPLHSGGSAPSVLEKSRLKLVGLPAAGCWRFGLKGQHRHLFAARKRALEEQGEDTPLPSWAASLGDEDWVFGTWDQEAGEMRFYRSLGEMLEVLVPPVEAREEFGDRTYARAMDAVEGALSVLQLAAPGRHAARGASSKGAELDSAAIAAAKRRVTALAAKRKAGSPLKAKAKAKVRPKTRSPARVMAKAKPKAQVKATKKRPAAKKSTQKAPPRPAKKAKPTKKKR